MRGRSIRFSAPRRTIADLLHFAMRMPLLPVERRFDISKLQAALGQCKKRPLWSAIFLKGFALVAREMPELRQVYMSFPRPRLYEYPSSRGVIGIEREVAGETGLFPSRIINDPTDHTLVEITAEIRHAKEAPLEQIKQFRRMLAFARLPRFLRRAVWWAGLNVGRQRAKYFGTFAVTTVGPDGASTMHPLAPVTSTVGYGLFLEGGRTDVRIVFDHRVLDGALMARSLVRLEEILNGPILEEIRSSAATPVA
jgi:hypothetical protein